MGKIWFENVWLNKNLLISLQTKLVLKRISMVSTQTRKFKNRLEEVKWIARQNGWGPLTKEEKAELDEIVRSVTNLN